MKRIPASSSTFGSKGALRAHPPDRVLYVEDERANWNVAKLQLGDSYDLVQAVGATDAFRSLREQKFYAVLLDVQLHGSVVDGLELARIIRFGPRIGDPVDAADLPECTRDLPLIIVTAFADTLSPAAIAAAGVDQVISKPVNFIRLSLAIANTHLRRVAARNAAPPSERLPAAAAAAPPAPPREDGTKSDRPPRPPWPRRE